MPLSDYFNIGLLTISLGMVVLNFRTILKTRPYWLLYFVVLSLTEYIGTYKLYHHERNWWVYAICNPIQFVLVVAYFLKVLQVNRIQFIGGIISSILIGLAFTLTAPLDTYNSFEYMVFEAIIVLLCVWYFSRIIQSDDHLDLSTSEFWYCCAFFTFNGNNLWINGSLQFLMVNDMDLARKSYNGLVASIYLLYVITTYAIMNERMGKKRIHG